MRIPRENRVKLSLHFKGPYVVKKKLIRPGLTDGNVYVIVDGDGNEYLRSMTDLKPYLFPKDGPEIPIPFDGRRDEDETDED